MFCTNCGAALVPGSAFCTNCGTRVAQKPTPPAALTPVPKKKNKTAAIALIAALVAILIIGITLSAIFLFPAIEQKRTVALWQEQYDLGDRYLSDGDYEDAVIAFCAAIEIDPKNPDAYLGAAEAYIALGDLKSAEEILLDGLKEVYDSSELEDMLEQLQQLLDAYDAVVTPEPIPEGPISEEPIPEEPQVPTQPQVNVDWKAALYDCIVADAAEEGSTDQNNYYLFYLNDDEIPELWIDKTITASCCTMAYFNGETYVPELHLRSYASYIERGNRMKISGGSMGVYWNGVYALENNEFVYLEGGYYEAMIDDEGYFDFENFYYYWEGLPLTEEEYLRYLDDAFNSEASIELYYSDTPYYTYEEILAFLAS